MRRLTHLSLFSGIGGLDLAAEWAGIETVGQCEWAEYPTKVLEKHWPDVPRWKDIKTLTGESFYERTGRRTVDIISGGFPCQPFSVAGKRRGKEDNRYLWPEMVRIIKELRPTWIVGENVAGIVRMALPDILSELEACGYRTRTFLIPACAVGARHRRYRVAIVGYSEHNGLSSAAVAGGVETTGGGEQERKETAGESPGTGESGNGKAVGGTEDMENSNCFGRGEQGNVCEQPGRSKFERSGKTMANTKSEYSGRLPIGEESEKPGFNSGSEDVQYSDGPRRKEQYVTAEPDKERFAGRRRDAGTSTLSDPDNRSRDVRRGRKLPTTEKAEGTRRDFGEREKEHESGERRTVESVLGGVADGISDRMDGDLDFIINHYWDNEPDIPRIATGIEHRVDRLKCLGNAVVPQQFYPVFRAIAEVEGGVIDGCS